MTRQAKSRNAPYELVQRCLEAFIHAGTLDLSLDRVSRRTGTSKRMLVHYFGGREELELRAMWRLEERLRARFAPEALPAGWSARKAVLDLWALATAPENRGMLLLIMDVGRRAWSGSRAAREFYGAQQRLWVELLLKFIPDRRAVQELFILFEGAALIFLITGDAKGGRRALLEALSRTRRKRRR